MLDGGDPDELTVLNFNTFLLEATAFGFQVSAKPAMEDRAKGIEQWFESLKEESFPDVLVLQEIFSKVSNGMVKALCSLDWTPSANPKVQKCTGDSPFSAATTVGGYPSRLNPLKSGGVVILTRRGVEMVDARDEVFQDASGMDYFAYKGFMAVWLRKQRVPDDPRGRHQGYIVVGTHTQAGLGGKEAAIRAKQLQEIRRFID